MRSILSSGVFTFLGLLAGSCCASPASAQTRAGSGTITGTVTDPSGAVVPGATVKIQNPVSQYERTATTDTTGHFRLSNIPFNSYHMTVAMKGFGTFVQDVDVRATTPVTVPITLSVGTAATTVDKYALYNFLSTFSATHYVTPRAITGQISLHF